MQQQRFWALLLIRIAAVFGLVGVVLGSKMSGDMDYSITPIHAHSLLVGWLSVFAWGIFYYVVPMTKLILVKIQAVMGIIGAVGLTVGMYFYMFHNSGFTTFTFVVGGSILLLAFLLFVVNTFFVKKAD